MKKLFIQGLKFIGISGIGWIIDFFIFSILGLFSVYVSVNNMLSSLIAVTFVFIVSTRKTFVQKENGINIKFKFVIYIIYQLLLIVSASFILAWLNNQLFAILSPGILSEFTALISKILVTPVTMLCNFVVMKLLIERV